MTTALRRRRRGEPAADSDSRLAAAQVSGVSHDNAAAASPQDDRIDGVVIGMVVDVGPGGTAVVDCSEKLQRVFLARSLITVVGTMIGRDVALMFENGNPDRPIVIAALHQQPEALARADDQRPTDETRPSALESVDVEVNEERITLTAEKEIVLRCGKASVTLTRAGKVLIKGEFVLTHARGVNRVRGGSVQIN